MTCTVSVTASSCSACKRWVIPPPLTMASLGGVFGKTEAEIRAMATHSVTGDPVADGEGNLKIVPVPYCPNCCPVCMPKPSPISAPGPEAKAA